MANKTVKLVQFPPGWGLPNASPFCMKLETWLRMADIEYENQYNGNPRGAPKQKLPYVIYQGQRIGDSELIIRFLSREFQVELDSHLSARDKADSIAYRALLEEHLYFIMLYFRWVPDDMFEHTKQGLLSGLPPVVNRVVPTLIRNMIKKQIQAQGMARHSKQELLELAGQDLFALSEFLADKPYALGEKLSSLDAVFYAFLANLLWVPEKDLKNVAQEFANFPPYLDRMRNQFFG